MTRWYVRISLVVMLGMAILLAGCATDEVDGDDYEDAPSEVRDESLDYQDYKEADCPYLDESLDQETMEKCNEWVRNQTDTPD